MTCCPPGAEAASNPAQAPETDDATLLAAAQDLGNGRRQLELAVPEIHCAACITTIEKALQRLPMVDAARVNFSTRRVRIAFSPDKGDPSELTAAIRAAGYRALLLDPDAGGKADPALTGLIRALAVSGFAAGNIMLFSVSIWSGADPVTRDLFHWISALIAVPAIAYAGRPFFRSALGALRQQSLNMDVPIALAILLALCLSLVETLNGAPHAYFDAAVSLTFFLLIGRTLDHVMREKARSAIHNLARLAPPRATRLLDDGRRESVAVAEITPGMTLLVTAGERVPVDAEIVSGTSDIDSSLVSGEPVPERVAAGSALLAGTTNLSGPLTIRASRPAAGSFLARMVEMMQAAEGSRAGYRRIADRAAAIYAPAVHLLALATFFGWGLLAGDWGSATRNAIAVLIITCPCALALAVPIVHVVAAGRLFEAGIMMRDGAALERLARITRIAFDKTGTLTRGRPAFTGQLIGDPTLLAVAAKLAAASRHPFSVSLAAAHPAAPFETATEVPGQGVEAREGKIVWRLGRAEFCHAETSDLVSEASVVWLARNTEPVAAFTFADQPRPEAPAVADTLHQKGYTLSLLSGDRAGPVQALADRLGIADARAGLTPEQKLAALHAFRTQADTVLMVGDGLNDAPALSAADASMAPASATDIGRNAADFVYTRDSLDAVPFALDTARRAARLVKENFSLALAYNCVAVPLAVSGQVTPLIAALAMSSSSVLVTLNALRLRLAAPPSAPEVEDPALTARPVAAQ